MTPPICIGHRGARGHVPENTLPSFERAIEFGCPWIELDVYLKDEHLIVIHDETVDRTTNGTGAITDLSYAQIRSLDAGQGAQIPTLPEVLDLVDRRCGVNIELKGKNTADAVSALLTDRCASGWSVEHFLLSSFRHPELARADPAFRRGALFGKRLSDEWQRAADLDAWSVNFNWEDVSADLVEQAHSRGYQVLVYTVNEAADIQHMIACGVDGIFTDYPDRMLSTP